MTTDDLERDVHRALRALPPPRAPATLLPRVMLAARAAALRPWYTRRWLAWPRRWQVASAAALFGVVGGAWALLSPAEVSLRPAGRVLGELLGPLITMQATVATTLAALQISARAIAPVLGLVGIICALMLVACVSLGASIGRLAFGGRYRS